MSDMKARCWVCGANRSRVYGEMCEVCRSRHPEDTQRSSHADGSDEKREVGALLVEVPERELQIADDEPDDVRRALNNAYVVISDRCEEIDAVANVVLHEILRALSAPRVEVPALTDEQLRIAYRAKKELHLYEESPFVGHYIEGWRDCERAALALQQPPGTKLL